MKRTILCTMLTLIVAAGAAYAEHYSIDSLKLSKPDLPEGYEFGNEIRSISIQPVTFYTMPEQMGLLPKPVKKAFQELRFRGTTRGTLMMFQYQNADDPGKAGSFLKGLLWGDANGPTEMHPEELYTAGNVIFIFCFGYGSGESRLVKEFFREKKGIALDGPDDPFKKVIAKAQRYYNSNDAPRGIVYLRKEYATIKDRSFGQYFLAEFYYMTHDWANAEKHYRLALVLHAGADPLPDEGSLWACHHGLGISCAVTGKVKESVEPFTLSLSLARKLKRNSLIASSAYDLSCSRAVLKNLDSAYALLAEAIQLDGKYKVMARGDDCFREALAEKRFADLLK